MRNAEQAAEQRQRLLGGTGGNRQNLRRAALGGADEMVAWAKKQTQKKKSPADEARELQRQVASSQFAFMNDLQGTIAQHAGNLWGFGGAAGGTDPRLYGEVKLQTDILRDLASNARGPGTRSAKNEIDAAFEGATF